MIVGKEMLMKVKRAREVFRFVQLNLPAYLRVLHDDFSVFREELIRTSVGLLIGAVGGLLFLSFLSIALLVSAWDTSLRLGMAWSICVGWAGLAGVGLLYARQALRAPVPFSNITQLLLHDLAAIEKD